MKVEQEIKELNSRIPGCPVGMYNLEIEIINTLKQEQLYGLLNIARFLYIYGKVWYPFDSFVCFLFFLGGMQKSQVIQYPGDASRIPMCAP